MMMWSSTGISINSPACFILRVSSSSALLGIRLPLGWLCDRITPQAFAFKAAMNTSLVSATVPATPPVDIS